MTEQVQAENVGFAAHLGLELTELTGDAVRGQMHLHPGMHQPYGIVHGGVYSSVVETVASLGAAHWFADRGQVVGVSNTTHFLRAVGAGVLQVAATPLHRGRTSQLWQVFVTDEQGRLVAKGEVRLANVTVPAVIGQAGGVSS